MLNCIVPVDNSQSDSITVLTPSIDMHQRNSYIMITRFPCNHAGVIRHGVVLLNDDICPLRSVFLTFCLCTNIYLNSLKFCQEWQPLCGKLIVCSTACSGLQQRNHQSPTWLASCKNPPASDGFPSQRARARKAFPWHYVIMWYGFRRHHHLQTWAI